MAVAEVEGEVGERGSEGRPEGSQPVRIGVIYCAGMNTEGKDDRRLGEMGRGEKARGEMWNGRYIGVMGRARLSNVALDSVLCYVDQSSARPVCECSLRVVHSIKVSHIL